MLNLGRLELHARDAEDGPPRELWAGVEILRTDLVQVKPNEVLPHHVNLAGVGDWHCVVEGLWGSGVELQIVVDGPHVVDVLVGRIRRDVAEALASWQFDFAEDAVPGSEPPCRVAKVALAHACPGLPLGQGVVLLVVAPCLADRHGQAPTPAIAFTSRRMGALLADPEHPHPESAAGASALDPLIGRGASRLEAVLVLVVAATEGDQAIRRCKLAQVCQDLRMCGALRTRFFAARGLRRE